MYLSRFKVWIFGASVAVASAQSSSVFISSLERVSAPAGAEIVLSGRGFGTTESNIRVFFGGATARSITELRDALLRVEVPAGASFDNVVIVDVSRNLRASSLEYFLPSFGGSSFSEMNFGAEVEVSLPLGTGVTPFYDVCSCDFDGDGKMDLAGASSSDISEDIGITSLPVFPNTTSAPGDAPTFGTPVEIVLGSPVRYVACEDLNNDGLFDLVAVQSSRGGTTDRNTLFYMRNTSSGAISFDMPQSFEIPNRPNGDIRNIGRVEIEDVDDDGKADLIIANRDDHFVFVYRNTSTSSNISFAMEPVSLPGTDNEDDTVNGLDVKDLNNDGLPEIVVGKTNEAVFLLQNSSTPGSVSFATTRQLADNTGRGEIRNLVVGDLNADAKNDIICSSDGGNRVVWLLNMTTDERGAAIAFEDAFKSQELGDPRASKTPWGIDLGDIDGDTKIDVLVSTAGDLGPYVLHNTTSDTRVNFDVYDLNRQRSRNLRIVDANLDGKPDLVIANANRANDAENNKIFVIPNTHCMKPEIMPTEGTICDGVDFFLEATPGIGIEYVWTAEPSDGGGALMSNTGSASRINLRDWLTVSTSNYVVRVEALIGACSGDAATSEVGAQSFFRRTGFAVDPPTIALSTGADEQVCIGENVSLNATPPTNANVESHHWSGPFGESMSKGWPLGEITSRHAGTYEYYYVASVSGTMCPSTKVSLTLEILNLPALSITAAAPYGCRGTSFTVQLEGTTSPLVSTYQWKRDGANISGATSITYDATQSGSYVLSYGDGSCLGDTPALEVSDVEPPTIFNEQSELWCRGVALRPQITAQVPSSAATVGLTALTYAWDMGDGATYSEATPTHTYTMNGSYTITLTVSYEELQGCSTMATQSIRLIETPTVTLLRSPDKEKKCPTEEITISAPSSGQVPGGGTTNIVSYLWSTGAQENTIKVRQPGTYKLTAMDDAGCTIEAETSVENLENSGISLMASEYGTTRPGEQDTLYVRDLEEPKQVEVNVLDLEGGTQGIQSWRRGGLFKVETPEHIKQAWPLYFASVLDTTVRHRPIITARYDEYADGPMIFRILARDRAGCLSEALISLGILPDRTPEGFRMFSPDGDNRLDRWRIYKLDLSPNACDLKIFDRRGAMVYELGQIPGDWPGWDGTFEGEPLPEDVYFYAIECACEEEGCPRRGSGSLLLLR